MAENIREWLTALELEKHIETFEAEGVAFDALASLTDEKLEALGVADALERDKLIAAAKSSGLESSICAYHALANRSRFHKAMLGCCPKA